jgi:hypothetical protein
MFRTTFGLRTTSPLATGLKGKSFFLTGKDKKDVVKKDDTKTLPGIGAPGRPDTNVDRSPTGPKTRYDENGGFTGNPTLFQARFPSTIQTRLLPLLFSDPRDVNQPWNRNSGTGGDYVGRNLPAERKTPTPREETPSDTRLPDESRLPNEAVFPWQMF